MQCIPYEILQLIAGSLLPRSQCRLAMVSRWCYKYVYNDLLKWHAKWSHIEIPKYRLHYSGELSLRSVNGAVVCTIKRSTIIDLITNNITRHIYSRIRYKKNKIEITHALSYYASHTNVFAIISMYGVSIFDNFYKNIHENTFAYLVSIRISPLLSLPANILYSIIILGGTCSLSPQIHEYFDKLFWNGPPSICYRAM